MKVIGITGGVGCGKSSVIERMSEEFNVHIIKTDDIGRNVLDIGTKGYEQFLMLFGEDFLKDDKSVDRAKLAECVFNNRNKLLALNSIVHPQVKQKVVEEITRVTLEDKVDYILVESALLIEEHYEVFCDEIWYITANLDARVDRLKAGRGYSREKTLDIINNQLDDAVFREKCDFVIDNSGDIQDTIAQVKKRLVVS